jgi:hypothetical protein
MDFCNCRSWCRDWSETQGFKFPASNHAPGCNLYRQEPFTALEYDGSRCLMEPNEADAIVADAPGQYTTSTVMLTRDQFEQLPEHAGF